MSVKATDKQETKPDFTADLNIESTIERWLSKSIGGDYKTYQSDDYDEGHEADDKTLEL